MRLYGPQEILNEIRRRNGQPVLVLVPKEWADQTFHSGLLNCEFVAKNGEHTLLAVRDPASQP
jgi:hypothetical protein